jgi:hypothetical protein
VPKHQTSQEIIDVSNKRHHHKTNKLESKDLLQKQVLLNQKILMSIKNKKVARPASQPHISSKGTG